MVEVPAQYDTVTRTRIAQPERNDTRGRTRSDPG